jgi:HEAT repeat protein
VPQAAIASSKTAAPAAPTGGVPQLLATLKDSMYPSQREGAAEQLSALNWRMQPQVIESLTKSARDDPSATVRAACVRALGHMKADSHEVVALMQDLKNDRDSRVRQQADETLNALGVAPRPDADVQQASHK